MWGLWDATIDTQHVVGRHLDALLKRQSGRSAQIINRFRITHAPLRILRDQPVLERLIGRRGMNAADLERPIEKQNTTTGQNSPGSGKETLRR